MATLAIPMCQMPELDLVEAKVNRVEAGLTFSQTMNIVIQSCFSIVHLTGAFHTAVREQAELIALLQHNRVQCIGSEALHNLAEKVEHLVQLNNNVLTSSALVTFRPWEGYLNSLQIQTEQLDSIAESFRMSADEASQKEIAALVSQADSESSSATDSSWRDFVATLED